MNDKKRKILLTLALALIAGSIGYLEIHTNQKGPANNARGSADIEIPNTAATTSTSGESRTALIEEKAQKYKRAKEIEDPAGFINTNKISIRDLVGKKVILVDFWTYSCINCQRTLPYVNAWYEKYKDQGLEVIGVHAPEFEFEKDHANVEAAVKKFAIKYPVVLDNSYGTWSAYANQYWPHKYLIDIDGFIVYDHIGEGFYDEAEKKIRDALEERMRVLGVHGVVDTSITNPAGTIGINFSRVGSPETYFGASRNTYLGNGQAGAPGLQNLPEPSSVGKNTLYLGGSWDFKREFAENKNSGATILYQYSAKNVYLVAGSKNGVRIKIMRDEKPLGSEAGADVSSDGTVLIKENRLYKLIEGKEYGEHTIEINVESPGLQAFTFTFG